MFLTHDVPRANSPATKHAPTRTYWCPSGTQKTPDTEDPRSSWVAQGAAESCTKRPCTCELGHELHHSRRPLRANGMATGLHWSFGGCPALLHYLPVFALHWSARKVKSPALALQIQDDQLGSPTAQDGAPTQLSP